MKSHEASFRAWKPVFTGSETAMALAAYAASATGGVTALTTATQKQMRCAWRVGTPRLVSAMTPKMTSTT